MSAAQNKESKSNAIHADPSKDFFVKMITRDISLSDCIFDLLDNSIDGARKQIQKGMAKSLKGFKATISFTSTGFQLKDNCGGIPLSDAVEYAFHFGRKTDQKDDLNKSIGLYGIGMKRAIFKIGRKAQVVSQTKDDSFSVEINVDTWELAKDWDFEWTDRKRTNLNGTEIYISNIYGTVAADFNDPVFARSLVMLIARDYAFFIKEGFEIIVGETVVPQYNYELKVGDHLTPAQVKYDDDGVSVRIVSGIIDTLSDEIPNELKPEEVERYGWFVICNGRVVIAADKSENTVWGVDDFKVWHPQYNGFSGFVFFDCDDPKKLPWTTTKRDIDTADPLYRRTVLKMKSLTDEFTKYSNERKGDPTSAKAAESNSKAVNISDIPMATSMKFPVVRATTKDDSERISFKCPKREVDEIRLSLGDPEMAPKDVGLATFEYYRRVELGK